MTEAELKARREAHRLELDKGRAERRETALRAREDEHGRELRRFASSPWGRKEFEDYKARVLARRAQLETSESVREPWKYLPTVWQLNVGTGGGGNHPFKGKKANKTDSPAAARVRVVFGAVNSVVPTIHDAVTAADVPLDGTTDTPPRPPVLATPTAGKVYLETVWSGAEPKILASAEVKHAASVPADDDTHGYQLLFTVTLNGASDAVESIAQATTSSYNVQRTKCGSATAVYYFTGITTP